MHEGGRWVVGGRVGTLWLPWGCAGSMGGGRGMVLPWVGALPPHGMPK